MKVFCGIDWAERHHDVALVDETGQLVAKKRISDDAAGFAALLELLGTAGDHPGGQIPVAIETSRGLLVAALRATGRPVYAINPMAVARYRERRTVSRTKSDHADAMTLADILRTDSHVHRQLPADTQLGQAVAVLARAHQDASWRRSRAVNELRSLLREYYPSFLNTFTRKAGTCLSRADARALLAIAPTPTTGAKLSKARIAAALRRAGRQRGINAHAEQLQAQLREPVLHQPELVEQALGRQALALLATLDAECASVDQLAQATIEAFEQHPDHAIITSFPGLGEITGARILGEMGDDRARFADARGVKAYAGSAPITRASGRSLSITHRRIKNNRFAAAGWMWAWAAIVHNEHARAHYQRRRDNGDRHSSALHHLFNRQLGQLWHCLQSGQPYNPELAFTREASSTRAESVAARGS
ncbi:IS110 family transposase [Kribbella sp. NPDC026611]|uniref:IS110 family transposase n=1 Tax=Kribbella sp. NPDC026611 TaxID=3154911 RepID=UPI0033DA7805